MGGGGDPSPVTAYGVYLGMKATAKKTFGSDSLEGKRIAVQGIGQVGYHLVELLVKENARVFIADLAEDKVKSVSRDLNVTGVELNDIYDLEMDTQR
jgi:leucine dehydrogenase